MLWLSGLHALDLTTSTPDALCPPLEEARAAVKARVGEVRGEFHAEFGLIRRDDGRQALELVLREGAAPVLRRELPLDEAGCDDAAQAIALVLERYFDTLEAPPPEAAPKLESVPATTDRPPSQVVAVPPRSPSRPAAGDDVSSSRADGSKKSLKMRAGLLYDRELKLAPTVGVTVFPRAFELSARLRIGAALDVTPFFPRRAQTIREQALSLATLQVAVSVPVTLELAPWALSFGPWAQFRFQRADAPSDLHGSTEYRTLPGLGAFAQVAFDLSPRWSLSAGLGGGAQFTGSAPRFVLQRDNGERNAVLVPESWFAQAQLAAVLSF